MALRLLFAGLMLIINGFILNRKIICGFLNTNMGRAPSAVLPFAASPSASSAILWRCRPQCRYGYGAFQYLSPVLILFQACLRKAQARGPGASGHRPGPDGHLPDRNPREHPRPAADPSGTDVGPSAAVSAVIYTTLPGTLVNRYDIYQVLGFGMFIGGLFMCLLVRPRCD